MPRVFGCIACVFAAFWAGAARAEPALQPLEEPKRSKVEKTLDMLGISSPEIHRFAGDMQARVDDGHFYFAREKVLGGEFSVRYKLRGGIGTDQAELYFSPDDSNMHYSVTREHALVGYALHF